MDKVIEFRGVNIQRPGSEPLTHEVIVHGAYHFKGQTLRFLHGHTSSICFLKTMGLIEEFGECTMGNQIRVLMFMAYELGKKEEQEKRAAV